MQEGSRLVDLGCGGGQLCIHAAKLGWRAVGVDNAPGMIDEARGERGRARGRAARRRLRRVRASGRRVRRRHGDGADRVPARRRRPLRRGGAAAAARRPLRRLVPEPALQPPERERLHGAGARAGTRRGCSRSCATQLARTTPGRAARAGGVASPRRPASSATPPPPTARCRRPSCSTTGARSARTAAAHAAELLAAAERHGFRDVETLALHPHPLPPALEPLAPRLYNRLALAWQRAARALAGRARVLDRLRRRLRAQVTC